jgi:uncharacterized damage-inducible protein DinB
MNAHVQHLLEHMFWADTRLLELLESDAARSAPQVMRLFGHILASERTWLLRVRGEAAAAGTAQPGRAELTLPELRELAQSNADGYAQLVAESEDVDLAADVVYASSQGVPYRNSLADILLHVAMHGSYHRGQIAMALRAAGVDPVNTDFIAFARLPHD